MSSSILPGTLEKFTTFGDLLRFLRRRAGLTQMELAIAVGYSDAQVSRLEQNLRQPDIPTVEARFPGALDIEDQPKTIARLVELAAAVRREDGPSPGTCPYKGLDYFDEADADIFVGREAATTRLLETVLEAGSSGWAAERRFLAVIGASGSGKSSLVRAGLVPAIRRSGASERWPVYIFTPTAHPLDCLATVLTRATESVSQTAAIIDDMARETRSLYLYLLRMAKAGIPTPFLLVVDQFEELFTLCRSDGERRAFVDNLLGATTAADSCAVVVVALRADFYAHCSDYPALRDALASRQEYIGAMTVEELCRAIEEPARRGRWEFEPGLVDLLLRDVGSEPGALPLLSHALFETWQRRRGRTMTFSGYTAAGGVRGAIAETAETVFTDQFNPEERAIARRIFLRLTEVSDETGAADTRRRAAVSELVANPESLAATQAVLKALTDARLITTSESSAEVAHEALIREWPRLRAWLTENREALRLHQNIAEATHEWRAANRDADTLYRGARLAQAREWALVYDNELNPQEREFLAAGVALSERESAEREAQRQRELEAARKLADTEKHRANEQARNAGQLRKQALFLASALIAALAMTLIALFFGARARDAMATAQAERRTGFSRELAAEATSNLDLDTELSVLLAMEAVSTTYSVDKTWPAEAEDALRRSLLASRVLHTLRGHMGSVPAVAFSPPCAVGTVIERRRCSMRLATAGHDGTARVWDAKSGKLELTLPTKATRWYEGLSFSPDGSRLATPGEAGTALVWNAQTGELLRTLSGHAGVVAKVAFSPDGKQLATASADRTARIWDAFTGEALKTLQGHIDAVTDVAFSLDGKYVATAGRDGTAILWDTAHGEEVRTFRSEHGAVLGLAFSPAPDATELRLATVYQEGTALVWNALTGQQLLVLRGHTDAVSDVAYSPDGKRLATAGLDGRVSLWDAATGQQILALPGHIGPVLSVAFSSDCATGEDGPPELCGTRLASTGEDGTTKIWNVSFSYELMATAVPHARGGAFSRDGTLTALGYEDGTVVVWELSGRTGADPVGAPMVTLRGHSGPINTLDFSPDGRQLATTSEDKTVIVWDLAAGRAVKTLTGHEGRAVPVKWSPEGKRLITAGMDNTVKVWDIQSGQATQTLPISSWTTTVAFAGDGVRIAAGMMDGTAKVWDATTGQELHALRGHGGEVWSVDFSPDGKRLATASNDATVKLWDVASGQELFPLRGHDGAVNHVEFNSDGTRLATAGQDGTARVWDAASGVELRSFGGQSDAVAGIHITRDNSRLLTAGNDLVLRAYVLGIEDLVALARSRVTRALTAEECSRYLHRSAEGCSGAVAATQREGAAGEAAITPAGSSKALTGKAMTPGQTGPKGKVCEVTDDTGIDGTFYNRLGYQGVQKAAGLFGWDDGLYEPARMADYEKSVLQAIEEGCTLIVIPAAISFGQLVAAVARANPDQKFLTAEWSEEQPLENVWVQTFAIDQAAFLAGYLAATMTKTGAVGTYGGFDFPPVTAFMDGYALGVVYYNHANGKQVRLLGWDPATRQGLFAGDFTDTSAGRRMAKSLMDQGADVIMPVAGDTGWGTAAEAKERGGVYVIGVDTDWGQNPDYRDIVLTSVLKGIDVGVVSAVRAIVDGSFAGGPHEGNIANGGVGIAPFHAAEDAVSPKVKADLEEIKAGIIAGTIRTRP